MSVVGGAPSVSFPLNSQVPPVARVSEEFDFTFSPNTFTSTAGSISYNLSSAPSWLSLDGEARHLSGTPGLSDVGSEDVILTATDSSGSTNMNCTLVVSTNPSPKLQKPLNNQLVAYGPVAGDSSLSLYPSSPFKFTFAQDTFVGANQSLNFYAVSVDNAPLPSWIDFDPHLLQFSGTTPQLTALIEPPQSFKLRLISSDVVGFGSASAEFNLTVGSHKLAFDNTTHIVNVLKGEPVTSANFRSSLRLDNLPVKDNDLKNIYAQSPDWMSFNKTLLAFSGVPPEGALSENVTVTVTDVYGDVANVTVIFKVAPSLFTGNNTELNATICEDFHYALPRQLLVETDLEAKCDVTPVVPWLMFDATKLEWSGRVPESTKLEQIVLRLTLTSRASQISDTIPLKLNLVEGRGCPAPTAAIGATTLPTTSASADGRKEKMKRMKIITAVVLSVLILTVATIGICIRYRKHQRKPRAPGRRKISRPLAPSQQSQFGAERADRQAAEPVPTLPVLKRFSGIFKSNPDLHHLQRSQHEIDANGKPGMPFISTQGKTSKPSSNAITVFHGRMDASSARTCPPPRPFRPQESSREQARHFVTPLCGLTGNGDGEPGPYGTTVLRETCGNTSRHTWVTIESSNSSSALDSSVGKFPDPPKQRQSLKDAQPSLRVVRNSDTTVGSTERTERYGYRRSGTSPYFGGSLRVPTQRHRSTLAPPSLAERSGGGGVSHPLSAHHEGAEACLPCSDLERQGIQSPKEGQATLRTFGSKISDNLRRMSRQFSTIHVSVDLDPSSSGSEGSVSHRDLYQNIAGIYPKSWQQADLHPGGRPELGWGDPNGDEDKFEYTYHQNIELGIAARAHRPSTLATRGMPALMGSGPATPRIVELRRKRPGSSGTDKDGRWSVERSHAASLASTNYSEDGQDRGKAFI